MTPSDATAEVFMSAFSQLPKAAKESFLSKLLRNEILRQDLIDITIAEHRRREKSRPFQKVAVDIIKKRDR